MNSILLSGTQKFFRVFQLIVYIKILGCLLSFDDDDENFQAAIKVERKVEQTFIPHYPNFAIHASSIYFISFLMYFKASFRHRAIVSLL